MSTTSHYNNIFNKKNIEFQLDGRNKTLPYIAQDEVSLKANQIIFSSINNIFQKFLDNDLYNEALLKKYIEYGYIGGPTYVSSIAQIQEDPTINKKFVVSGPNGISVLRREIVEVEDTLSGAFLSGTKVNKIEFINSRYVACTINGIYESIDKTNWKRVVGENGKDVVDICYNQNFLNGSGISAYDYVAVANIGNSIQFYGHNGTNNSWKDFSKDGVLSSMAIDGMKAERIYTFEDDPLFYIGTNNNGLLASDLFVLSSEFDKEIGTDHWSVYDMAVLPNEDDYNKYLLATNYGIKQSQKLYGFKNLKKRYSAITYVYDVLKFNDGFYIAAGEGLFYLKDKTVTEIQALRGIPCYSLTRNDSNIYVGTENGLYRTEYLQTERIAFNGEKISKVLFSDSRLFAYSETHKKIYHSTDFDYWNEVGIDLSDDIIKQLIAHNGMVYVVSDKTIYALTDGNNRKMFLWQSSIANEDNVYFAQNITASQVLVQINSDICLIDSETNNQIFRIESAQPLVGNNKIASALKHGNNFYVVVNSMLYLIKQNEQQWQIENVEINGEQVAAKRIAAFSNPAYDGIAFINANDEVKFLRLDIEPNQIESVSKNSNHKDVSVLENSIYSISGNHKVVRYDIGTVDYLSKVENIQSGNGVSLIEYNRNFGCINDRIREDYGFAYALDKNAYLSTFSNNVDLSINGETTLTASIEADSISCSDFIGYIDNTNMSKTLLIGGSEDGVSAFRIAIGNSGIDNPIPIRQNILNKKANSFADICYRRQGNDPATNNGSAINAFNFIGTDDGVYAISAISSYIKQCDTDFTINNIISAANGNRYAATNSGIYAFDPTIEENFDNVGIISPNTNINFISKYDDKLVASIRDNVSPLVSSDNESGFSNWTSMWKNTESFVNFVSDPDSPDAVLEHKITSDFAYAVSVDLPTISHTDSNSNSISFLSNALQLHTSDIDLKNIIALYKDTDESIKIIDNDKKVYIVQLDQNYKTTLSFSAIQTNEAIVELSSKLSTIIENGGFNSLQISDKLSAGYNDLVSSDFLKDYDYLQTEVDVEISSVPFISNLIHLKNFADELRIQCQNKNAKYEDYYSGLNVNGGLAYISGTVNFENSYGISSLQIIPTISFSGDELSTYTTFELQELCAVSEAGHLEPILANEDTEIVNPETGAIIPIHAGEALSEFVEIQHNSIIHKTFVNSDVATIIQNDISTFFVSTDFTDQIAAFKPIEGSTAKFEVSISAGNAEYSDGHSDFDNELDIYYEISSNISYNGSLTKTLLPIQESIDEIYYSNVVYGEDKKSLYGFINKTIDGILLHFDGSKLYAADGFDVTSAIKTIGFVQIAETYGDPDFNDLYYFYTGTENDRYYTIRKTKISVHDKNFNAAKELVASAGDITKMSLEGNTLYVVKGRNLYYTSSSVFPNFIEITNVPIGALDIEDIASCNRYTYVVLQNRTVYRYSNGVYDGVNFALNGELNNFFVEDEEIYFKTSTGIWTLPYGSGTQQIKISDFTNKNIVRSAFFDNSFYHTPVIIGEDSVYAIDILYDFSNGNYSKLSAINEEIVDIKAIDKDSQNPHILAASNTKIYDIAFSNLNGQPSYSVKTIEDNFSSINAIYFSNTNGLLYVIDGNDLHKIELNLSLENPIVNKSTSLDFIDRQVGRLTMNEFGEFDPGIVASDSLNKIGTIERFVEREVPNSAITPNTSNLNNFIVNSQPENGRAYLYSNSTIYNLVSNGDQYGLNIIQENRNFNDLKCINAHSIDNKYSLWSFNGDKVKEQIVPNSSEESIEYNARTNPTLQAIFYESDKVCLGASSSNNGSKAGIYRISEIIGITEDQDDEVHIAAETLNGGDRTGREFFLLDFIGNDYIFNYTLRKTDGDTTINPSFFRSKDTIIEDYLNNHFNSSSGVLALSYMFGRYLFISDGYTNYVYDNRTKVGNQILFTQLETLNGSSGYLMFAGMRDGTGVIGYENSFMTFDGFSNIRGYGDVDNRFVALLSNFKRGSRIIKILNEDPDFLIGTTFGLKYVYDDLMTRSFYNKENRTQINRSINAIEKVLLADNDEYFIVGEENSLYEVTGLYNANFRKIYDFDENEKILDIFVNQKNEYIIATTNGIYITALRYDIKNDLSRFTINNIYEIINDELKKIIQSHINSDHKASSIITKVNKKADNRLLFLSNVDKHSEKYDSNIANAVKIIENDIIDTIVRGGEDPEADSFVKVGISNWAMKNIATESTYTDPGFVNVFTDPTSGKVFDISTVPYIVKNWKSGLKEIYIYVPTTGTYYANNPQGISNSKFSYNIYSRANVPNSSLLNTLPDACTTLRVYLYNSYFKIKTILAAQCTGNSLPLKIYKDNANADDSWKGVFDTAIQPSALRTLPMTKDKNVNNVSYCTDSLDRIFLDFSIYGTDAQAIRIIAES